MKRKSHNKTCILMLIVGVLFLFSPGCSKTTKHKVLTFFFTGVPTLEEIERQKQEAEEKRKKKEELKKQAELQIAKTSEVPLETKEVAHKPKIYVHTPYAAGRCNGCHRQTSASFTMFRSKEMSSTFTQGGGKPGVLLAPRKELCIKCHEYLSPDKASSSGLWLHTTAAKGDCNACHEPHQSTYPGLLLEKPEEICRECHSNEKIMNIPDHSKLGECLDCHNPHLGKNRMMLKKDYTEKGHPTKESFDSRNSDSLSHTTESKINPQNNAGFIKNMD